MICTAIVLAGGLAHLFELPNKVRLPADATFYLMVSAVVCLALNLVVFFAVTFPVNRKTENWTRLPANWEALRRRWEYSHAFNAVLAFVALCLLVLSLVRQS